MFDLSLSRTATAATENWFGFLFPGERIFVLYLLTSLAIAWVVWRLQLPKEKKSGAAGMKDFFSYVLDPAIYKHRSSWQDYFIFLVNGLLYYGIIAQFVISEHAFAVLARKGLGALFGIPEQPVLTGLGGIALFTVIVALLYDLGVYCAHYMTHKIPALWAFHKMHHSAEVLTPVTLLRMHPVDLFLNALLITIFIGAGTGLFSYLTLQEVTGIQVLGINALLFAFYVTGYNLRHSHIWLHYPAWLSFFLISPAQHQIHHSAALHHRDKNLGLMFSFWDRMFGTLYSPKGKEELVLGISTEEPNPYRSVKEMYIGPFRECRDMLLRSRKGGIGSIFDIAGLAVGIIAIFMFYFHVAAVANGRLVNPPSVYIEELTWTEIHSAQRNGFDTVIIPTGGTEQNGPHMVLGKHNYIVRHTAGEIAKRLGNTLVAPVIPYVPEGEITPKLTDNMQHPGTIGVPPQVLEDTLYWAAYSLKQHGFKYIYFIGDHGFNQAPQQQAAEKLTTLWKKDGIIVASISKYYDPANGQIQWLEKQGFTDKDIGAHAGIRDTSELIYVHPKGLRQYPVTVPGAPSGVQGTPSLATKEIGEKMIGLKVSAAVDQMRAIRATGKKPSSP